MSVRRCLRALLVLAAAAGAGASGASAVCLELGGFAIFQCADTAYVAPPPVPATFDANNRVTNITTVFWQIGFGNHTLNTGGGVAGTGNTLATKFNGNDQGLSLADVGNAKAITGSANVPTGALCLANNNWGNAMVDGCCDNDRGITLVPNNDDILNPLYDVPYARAGYPGLYSNAWVQDYPTAFLMKTLDGRYFAVAAVASMDRGSTGPTDGPCASPPGTNPAPCDYRLGFYEFKAITNGQINAATGIRNVVPWQQVPRPRGACIAACIGSAVRTMNFSWDPAVWYHDGTHRATSHPQMGPADATRPSGVGVLDLLTFDNAGKNWWGLIHYDLEYAVVTASNLDPNGRVNFSSLAFATDTLQPQTINVPQPNISPTTGNPTQQVLVTGVQVPSDTCWRVRVKFGKKPETLTTDVTYCRLGMCGDKGYSAETLDSAAITCVGGALFAEQFTDVSAARSRGGVVARWTLGSELSVVGYNVYVVTVKGEERRVNPDLIPCAECGTGVWASYEYAIPNSAAKGAKAVIVEALAAVPLRSDPVPITLR